MIVTILDPITRNGSASGERTAEVAAALSPTTPPGDVGQLVLRQPLRPVETI